MFVYACKCQTCSQVWSRVQVKSQFSYGCNRVLLIFLLLILRNTSLTGPIPISYLIPMSDCFPFKAEHDVSPFPNFPNMNKVNGYIKHD